MTNQESLVAYQRLADAASELADSSRVFKSEFPLLAALCIGLSGLLINPGCWSRSLPPIAESVEVEIRRKLPDLREQVRIETN